MKQIIRRLPDLLFLLIPFVDFTFYLDYKFADIRLTYLVYILYFFVYIKNFLGSIRIANLISKTKLYIYLFAIVIITSIYNIFVDNNTIVLFLKQIIIIAFIAFVTYMFFYNHKDNIKHIITLYLKISFIVACIGIFQELSFLLNFHYGYNYSYLNFTNQIGVSGLMFRVTSIAREPSFLIYALMPAFYISLSSFLTNSKDFLKQWQNIIIILCVFLTYSAVGYTGIFLSFALILFWNTRQIKPGRFLLFIFMSIFLFTLGKSAVSDRIVSIYKQISPSANHTSKDNKEHVNMSSGKSAVSDRIVSIYKQISPSANHTSKDNKEHVNMSSYYLVLHAKRAFDDFKHKPVVGTGLGSYTYPKHADQVYEKFHSNKFFHVSSEDVANLFFRIVSELGLFGIIVLFIFLFSNYIFNISFRNQTNYFIIINNACLIYICLRLLRNGSYYADGLWIFIFMYYYSKQLFTKENKR